MISRFLRARVQSKEWSRDAYNARQMQRATDMSQIDQQSRRHKPQRTALILSFC